MQVESKKVPFTINLDIQFPAQSESVTRAVFEDELYEIPAAPDDGRRHGFLDVGAHFGAVSVLAYFRGYKVWALEPARELQALLRHNLSQIGASVNASFAALVPRRFHPDHAEGGPVDFWFNDRHPGGSKLAVEPPREPSYRVSGYTLPVLLSWGGIDCVDLVLKLDCEGAEAALFDCSAEDLEHVVGIFMEWHTVGDEAEYTEFLQRHGYTVAKKGRNWKAWR